MQCGVGNRAMARPRWPGIGSNPQPTQPAQYPLVPHQPSVCRKPSPLSPKRSPFMFKDNIITFTEQGTMTARRLDAACHVRNHFEPSYSVGEAAVQTTPLWIQERPKQTKRPVTGVRVCALLRKTLYNDGISDTEFMDLDENSASDHQISYVEVERRAKRGAGKYQPIPYCAGAARGRPWTRWDYRSTEKHVCSYYPEAYIPCAHLRQSRYHGQCCSGPAPAPAPALAPAPASHCHTPRARSPLRLPKRVLISEDFEIPT